MHTGLPVCLAPVLVPSPTLLCGEVWGLSACPSSTLYPRDSFKATGPGKGLGASPHVRMLCHPRQLMGPNWWKDAGEAC